jgi:hypothetical protein
VPRFNERVLKYPVNGREFGSFEFEILVNNAAVYDEKNPNLLKKFNNM